MGEYRQSFLRVLLKDQGKMRPLQRTGAFVLGLFFIGAGTAFFYGMYVALRAAVPDHDYVHILVSLTYAAFAFPAVVLGLGAVLRAWRSGRQRKTAIFLRKTSKRSYQHCNRE